MVLFEAVVAMANFRKMLRQTCETLHAASQIFKAYPHSPVEVGAKANLRNMLSRIREECIPQLRSIRGVLKLLLKLLRLGQTCDNY